MSKEKMIKEPPKTIKFDESKYNFVSSENLELGEWKGWVHVFGIESNEI
jgi:hypothetical protein